jgi:hypothetical protein
MIVSPYHAWPDRIFSKFYARRSGHYGMPCDRHESTMRTGALPRRGGVRVTRLDAVQSYASAGQACGVDPMVTRVRAVGVPTLW